MAYLVWYEDYIMFQSLADMAGKEMAVFLRERKKKYFNQVKGLY